MTIQVTGVLADSGGNIAPNVPIRIYTTTGYGETMRTATLDAITSPSGEYDFPVAIGQHIIFVRYNERYENLGETSVNSDTQSPQTLDSLLTLSEPITPAGIQELVDLTERAEAAAGSASISETSAGSAAESASNSETNAAASEASAASSASNASKSASDAYTYNRDAIAARDAAENYQRLSMLWAQGYDVPDTDPSTTNNSKYWSDLAQVAASDARNNANQTFKSGGYFTPEDGAEYPDVTGVEVDTIWLIKYENADDTYTMTTGALAGVVMLNGFMIVYDTPDDTFDYIPTVMKGANSVNGVTPDAGGDIKIIASDVNTYDKPEINEMLAPMTEQININTGNIEALINDGGGSGGGGSVRDLCVNGCFTVWQKGDVTANTINKYPYFTWHADKWFSNSSSANLMFSKVSDNYGQNSCTHTVSGLSSSSSMLCMYQHVDLVSENKQLFIGKPLTVGLEVDSDLDLNCYANVQWMYYKAGTSGLPTSIVTSANSEPVTFTANDGKRRYMHVEIPSFNPPNAVDPIFLNVNIFYYNAGNNKGLLDGAYSFKNVDFNLTDVETPYSQKPLKETQEHCYREFYRIKYGDLTDTRVLGYSKVYGGSNTGLWYLKPIVALPSPMGQSRFAAKMTMSGTSFIVGNSGASVSGAANFNESNGVTGLTSEFRCMSGTGLTIPKGTVNSDDMIELRMSSSDCYVDISCVL